MPKSGTIRITIAALFCLLQHWSKAQPVYGEGDTVQNLQLKKVLNSNSTTAGIPVLDGKITIVDFFGTWCLPCLRALPGLQQLKEQFGNEVGVWLVSAETEDRLQDFIRRRKDFPFPIVVDEGEEITRRFAPPSLPYTVVLNNRGLIIAVTEAEAITADKVKQWLNPATQPSGTRSVNQTTSPAIPTPIMKKSSNTTVALSQDFLYAARTGADVELLLRRLSALSPGDLSALSSDNLKKAFWINLYNGYTQAVLKKQPELYENRRLFFGSKHFEVAGMKLSLDDIEHDFLRRSSIKWGLGYLRKPFAGKREKNLRLKKGDYRIHFALNCGASSCPPIAFYSDEGLDNQLELATRAYISGEAVWDEKNNLVHLPAIMSWFRGDFGGKSGVRAILKKHGVIPANAKPRIRFKKYNWTLELDNYSKQHL